MTLNAHKALYPVLGLATMLLFTAGVATAQRGRVQMENGDPPPQPVLVKGLCSTVGTRTLGGGKAVSPNAQGYTDAEGNFNLSASVQPAIKSTAAAQLANQVNLPIPGTDLCSAQAIAPGYRASNPPPSTGRIVIILHPVEQTEGYAVSATSALAPEGSRKAFEKGMQAMADGDLKGAEKSFRAAVKIYDRYAEGWYHLGEVYRQQDEPKQARKAFLKAIAADSGYVYPYEDLYQLAFERDDMEDLLEQTDTLLRLNPFEFPGAYYYSAVANLRLKHYEAGEERIRAAIEHDPDYEQPMEYYVLGFLLSGEGRLAEALGAFDIYLALQPDGDSAKEAREARDTLKKRLDSQTLLQPAPSWRPRPDTAGAKNP